MPGQGRPGHASILPKLTKYTLPNFRQIHPLPSLSLRPSPRSLSVSMRLGPRAERDVVCRLMLLHLTWRRQSCAVTWKRSKTRLYVDDLHGWALQQCDDTSTWSTLPSRAGPSQGQADYTLVRRRLPRSSPACASSRKTLSMDACWGRQACLSLGGQGEGDAHAAVRDEEQKLNIFIHHEW